MSYNSNQLSEEELEYLLSRKYEALLRKMSEEKRKRQELEAEARRREMLRMILTPKARERLANLRLVRPDLVRSIEDQLIALAMQGRIKTPITDDQLKAILEDIYSRTRRDVRIRIREK